MKHVQERFTEDEYQLLKEAKGERTWREAILEDIAGTEAE